MASGPPERVTKTHRPGRQQNHSFSPQTDFAVRCRIGLRVSMRGRTNTCVKSSLGTGGRDGAGCWVTGCSAGETVALSAPLRTAPICFNQRRQEKRKPETHTNIRAVCVRGCGCVCACAPLPTGTHTHRDKNPHTQRDINTHTQANTGNASTHTDTHTHTHTQTHTQEPRHSHTHTPYLSLCLCLSFYLSHLPFVSLCPLFLELSL